MATVSSIAAFTNFDRTDTHRLAYVEGFAAANAAAQLPVGASVTDTVTELSSTYELNNWRAGMDASAVTWVDIDSVDDITEFGAIRVTLSYNDATAPVVVEAPVAPVKAAKTQDAPVEPAPVESAPAADAAPTDATTVTAP